MFQGWRRFGPRPGGGPDDPKGRADQATTIPARAMGGSACAGAPGEGTGMEGGRKGGWRPTPLWKRRGAESRPPRAEAARTGGPKAEAVRKPSTGKPTEREKELVTAMGRVPGAVAGCRALPAWDRPEREGWVRSGGRRRGRERRERALMTRRKGRGGLRNGPRDGLKSKDAWRERSTGLLVLGLELLEPDLILPNSVQNNIASYAEIQEFAGRFSLPEFYPRFERLAFKFINKNGIIIIHRVPHLNIMPVLTGF